MLGSSSEENVYKNRVSQVQPGNISIAPRAPAKSGSGENVSYQSQQSIRRGLNSTTGSMDADRQSSAADEQDLLCDESVANDSADFDRIAVKDSKKMNDYHDGNELVIDFGGDNRNNNNNNNNNIDTTPAILRAVSLATAPSMVARPTLVPVGIKAKRDFEVRPSPPTSSGGAKLTKKGTVPVREAVDPAKYVRLQDVDGVRYACSKCGNVYKWRKSLNKHWKEKHDGEIPVPASGSFSSILNIPHIKASGATQYSTPKPASSSSRAPMVNATPVNAAGGGISSYALDKYIVDMGAQSGGRSIQSYNATSNSPAAVAAAAAVMASRNMLDKSAAAFNPLLHASLPYTSLPVSTQPMPFSHMRVFRPDNTVTTSVLPKFHDAPQGKMRLPTILPPAAHSQGFMKHEVLDDANADDMPLDLSKKSTVTSRGVLDLTAPSVSPVNFVKGSSRRGDQPLDFSIKSNPGSERSTPVPHGGNGRDDADLQDHAGAWSRNTSTPGSDHTDNFQCYKCPFVAADKASFENHLEQHSSSNSQYPQCAQCKQHFSSNDELTQHFGLHHLHALSNVHLSEEDHVMDEAANPTASSQEAGQLYQYLTNTPASKEAQRCVVCNARFPRQTDLAKHFTHLHTDLPNPYTKKRSHDGHVDDQEPWHKVSKLHDKYGSEEGRKGSSEGDLECEQCTFIARDVAEMSRHQLVHSFNRPHACTMCGFSSKSREELHTHMWKYHPGHAEELAMMASNGGAATPVSLTKAKLANEDSPRDMDTSGSSAHSGEFGFDDVIIVTPNTTEVPLVRGRKIMGGKGGTSSSAEILLPYKCSVCEYRARWPSEITQHMKNHSDEKPYHCPRCTYKSKWKWDVVKHLKRCGGGTVKDVIDTTSRTGSARKSDHDEAYHQATNLSVVKQLHFQSVSPKPGALSNGPPNVTVLPAMCDGEGGNQSPSASLSDLMQQRMTAASSPANSVDSDTPVHKHYDDHSRINEGLYNCLQCPFTATSPAELRRHCQVHSENKPYTCRTCGYSTKWKSDLTKHVKTYDHCSASEADGARSADEDVSSSDELSIDIATSGEYSQQQRPILYKCDKCQYVTYKKNLLDGHQRIHRQASGKGGKLKCKQCDFTAPDLSSFLQHKLTHTTGQGGEVAITGDMQSVNSSVQTGTAGSEREVSPQRHRRKPVKYSNSALVEHAQVTSEKLDASPISRFEGEGMKLPVSQPTEDQTVKDLSKHAPDTGKTRHYFRHIKNTNGMSELGRPRVTCDNMGKSKRQAFYKHLVMLHRKKQKLLYRPVILKSAVPVATRNKAKYARTKYPLATANRSCLTRRRRKNSIFSKYRCKQPEFSSDRRADLDRRTKLQKRNAMSQLAPQAKLRVVLKPFTVPRMLRRWGDNMQQQQQDKRQSTFNSSPYASDRNQLKVLRQRQQLHLAERSATTAGVGGGRGRRLRCAVCPYHTCRQALLDAHARLHIAPLASSTTISLAFNNNIVHKQPCSTACQYCQRNFNDVSEREIHEQQHIVGAC